MNTIAQRLDGSPVENPISQRALIRVPDILPAGHLLATISDLDGLDALGPEWSSLFQAFGKPQQVFQVFEWLRIWAAIYVGQQIRLAIVTGRIDGRLVFVWPLAIRKVLGVRVLTFMGDPLSQYGDAFMEPDLDDGFLDAAFDHAMAMPIDVASFRRVRDDAAIAPMLRRRLGPQVNVTAAPLVDLTNTPSLDVFEKRFAGKLRASRRRRRRRLEERGSVTFETHGPSREAASLVATALAFKRDRARQRGTIALALRDQRFEKFFVEAALAGTNAPDLRVSALRCGSQILGVEISVACKGRLFGHVLAPRPDLGSLGLGGILAEATIGNAISQGYTAVDLLAPADPYKLEWTTTCVGVGDHAASLSLPGALYSRLWLTYGRDAAKALSHRLRPVLAASAPRPSVKPQS